MRENIIGEIEVTLISFSNGFNTIFNTNAEKEATSVKNRNKAGFCCLTAKQYAFGTIR